MPRNYPVEFKEKGVHQIIEVVRLESCSLQRACTEVGKLLGVSHHTLRTRYWRSSELRDSPDASGGETMEEELGAPAPRKPRAETKNAILKTASAFFAAEPTSP